MSPRILPSLAAGALGLFLLGCAGEAPDAETQARRDRGKDEAISRGFTKASDCGALSDKEEVRGCAAYVNSLDD